MTRMQHLRNRVTTLYTNPDIDIGLLDVLLQLINEIQRLEEDKTEEWKTSEKVQTSFTSTSPVPAPVAKITYSARISVLRDNIFIGDIVDSPTGYYFQQQGGRGLSIRYRTLQAVKDAIESA